MTAIVMNTLLAAVTEYDWAFTSIAAGHATSNAQLVTLGGNDDAGSPIAAELRGGTPGGSNVQMVGTVFLALQGTGDGTLIVQGRDTEWEYPCDARTRGVSTAKPGRGIRESYLGFGYRNANGHAFTLDRIDAEVIASKNRRK